MSTNQAKDQNTEQDILNAAETLFMEKGYARTSTVEIARTAGCNQALVHYYFRSKENLFQTIYAGKVATFLQGIILIDNQNSFEEAITHVIGAHFDFLLNNERLPHFIIDELICNPERLNSLKNQIQQAVPTQTIKHLEKLLQEAIDDGRVRETSVFDVAITIFSLNVMLFIARPVMTAVMEKSDSEFDALLAHRRQENIETVLRSLKP